MVSPLQTPTVMSTPPRIVPTRPPPVVAQPVARAVPVSPPTRPPALARHPVPVVQPPIRNHVIPQPHTITSTPGRVIPQAPRGPPVHPVHPNMLQRPSVSPPRPIPRAKVVLSPERNPYHQPPPSHARPPYQQPQPHYNRPDPNRVNIAPGSTRVPRQPVSPQPAYNNPLKQRLPATRPSIPRDKTPRRGNSSYNPIKSILKNSPYRQPQMRDPRRSTPNKRVQFSPYMPDGRTDDYGNPISRQPPSVNSSYPYNSNPSVGSGYGQPNRTIWG